MSRIERIWYKGAAGAIPLLPISWLFRLLVTVRRWLYQRGWLTVHRFTAPLIVVGNITVGGTGKTPFVIWLINCLRRAGYKPGMVSRGYGGGATEWPQQVTSDSDPALVGDEAVLLANRCQCPMAVAPDRSAAVTALLDNNDCDVVIADDGLQHYAMGRDIEVVIIDGQRRFGNGQMLPAGPLREPVTRLNSVDLCIVNGETVAADEYRMTLTQSYLYNLQAPSTRQAVSYFKGQAVHAVAGIGNPERFFDLLRNADVEVVAHPFSDHHAYSADDLAFSDDLPIVMTEKDAVKCMRFARPNHWAVAIEMAPTPESQVEEHLLSLLNKIDTANN